MKRAEWPFGDQLRGWRQRRHLSQLQCALEADISQRHLSFIESGRSLPSRDMVLLLAERLEVPLRERNALLMAAGFAPVYRERSLDDPALASARAAIATILERHHPLPALALDRHWRVVMANTALGPLLQGVAPQLLAPPINVMRLSLHPEGLSRIILNLPEWRGHLLDRLRRQIAVAPDATLRSLLGEVESYPAPAAHTPTASPDDVVVPLRLQTAGGPIAFLSTTTVFGNPTEITLSELMLELFYPADEATAEMFRAAV